MKKIFIIVSVENLNCLEADPIEYELYIDIREESYNKLIPICKKIDEEWLDDDVVEDMLKEEAPEVLREIVSAIEIAMPEELSLQKDENIEDFIFEPLYSRIDL